MNLVGTVFAPQFPVAQLHWILADKYACITIECVREGLKVYDNPAGVLTNNPPFEQQMFLLNQYMHLSPKQPENHFPSSCHYRPTAAAWVHLDFREIFLLLPALQKWHLPEHMQYREILRRKVSASFSTFWDRYQQRGCCEVAEGKYEITIYTSCWNAQKGIYYYNTYENHQITAVDMHRENLDGTTLARYPLIQKGEIRWQN